MDISTITSENVNKRDSKGNTPLFYSDEKDTIKLINLGADVNHQNFKERTALFGASYEKSKILIEAGIDIDLPDESYATALFLADEKTTRLLLDKGANIESSDMEGDTALSVAASYNHVDKCKTLIERGASIHGINLSTFTTIELMSEEVREFALNHEKAKIIEEKEMLEQETKIFEELPKKMSIPKF